MNRRKMHYSIRTLMVFIASVSILFAFLAWFGVQNLQFLLISILGPARPRALTLTLMIVKPIVPVASVIGFVWLIRPHRSLSCWAARHYLQQRPGP